MSERSYRRAPLLNIDALYEMVLLIMRSCLNILKSTALELEGQCPPALPATDAFANHCKYIWFYRSNTKTDTLNSAILYVHCIQEGRSVLFNDRLNTFYLQVIWRRIYGKGPLRMRERKPTAATWATLSD